MAMSLKKSLLPGNFISTQTVMLRAASLRQARFDERLPRLQDWDLWLTLSASGRFAFAADVLVHQHLSEDSITMDRAAYFHALSLIIDKHVSEFRRSPAVLASHRFTLAAGAWQTGDCRVAFRHLAVGVRDGRWIAVKTYARRAYNRVARPS